MKLLVTGGLGFIGSNFIIKVLEEKPNFEIINVDAQKYGSNPLNLQEIEQNSNYNFIQGDITDFDLMKKVISETDVVINFAAESHVDRSIKNSKPFIDSNILGVYTILENIKNQNKKLVHISTDEVYGSLETGSADENYKFNPTSPYAASKASAELLINSYFLTHNCNVVTTRCANNYGPRQFPEKLIPKVIILAEQNKKIPVYGNGKNKREWIYVDDHIDAILSVLDKGTIGNAYNITNSNEIDNISLIKKILKIMDKSEDLIEFVEDRPGHDFRYSMKSEKIEKFGWENKINFEKGINYTVEWYLKNK